MGYPRRHPLIEAWNSTEWNPELVGKVPGYARTKGTHEAHMARLKANSAKARERGRLHRTGVPDGYANLKADALAAREHAGLVAERVVQAVTADAEWDWRARLALEALYRIAVDPTSQLRDRIAAAKRAAGDYRHARNPAELVSVS